MGNREFLGTNTEVDDVIYIIAAAVTIVVVAIPEGLPLAVTLVVACLLLLLLCWILQ